MSVFISLLLLSIGSVFANKDYFDPKVLLESIRYHETIPIDVEQTESGLVVMKISAFQKKFEIVMSSNDNLIESNIRLTHGFPEDYVPKTESCHFHAKVVNTEQTNYGAFSWCDARGIRGHFAVGQDTYFIKPAAHFFDRERVHHTVFDKYIIYRQSDMELPEYNHLGYVPNDDDEHEHSMPIQNEMEQSLLKNIEQQTIKIENDGRRRTLAHNGQTLVEIRVFVGELVVQSCRYRAAENGENWFTYCMAQITDLFNKISAVYANNGGRGWNNDFYTDIGSIIPRLVEVTFIPSYTGTYADWAPTIYYYTTCNGQSNDYTKGCQIQISPWFNQLRTWIGRNAEINNDYDNVVILYGVNTGSTAGIAGVGAMCSGYLGQSSSLNLFRSPDLSYKTVIHEMGHNLGGDHGTCSSGKGTCPIYQGSSNTQRCGENEGVMGYGSNKVDYFSVCGLKSMKAFIDRANLACLNHKEASSATPKTNYQSILNQLPALTPSPIADTSGCTRGAVSQCVQIANMTNDANGQNFNGKWKIWGCQSGYPVYFRSETAGKLNYIYHTGNLWAISSQLSGGYFAYCYSRNIDMSTVLNCDANSWNLYDGSGFSADNSVTVSECVTTPTEKPSKAPTKLPTKGPTKQPSTSPTPSPTNNPTEIGQTSQPSATPTSSPTTTTTAITVTANPALAGCSQGYVTCLTITDSLYPSINGEWIPESCDANGYPIYSHANLGYKIYKYSWAWVMGQSLSSILGYCSQRGSSVTVCGGSLLLNTASGYTRDRSATFIDCGENAGAFTADEDLSCLDKEYNQFNQHLCIFGNNSIWTGHADFKLDGTCLNSQPVYRMVGKDGDSNLTEHYVLSFDNTLKKYVTDNTTLKRWVISNAYSLVFGSIVCEKENVLECGQSHWLIKDMVFDDVVRDVVDQSMIVHGDECQVIIAEDQVMATKQKDNVGEVLLIVGIVVVVILLVIVGAFGYYQWKKKQGVAEFRNETDDVETAKVMMGDESPPTHTNH